MSYAPRETQKASEPAEPSTEPTGPIAADSLAAESLNSGGDFASNEPSQPQPMGVKGASSTLANTDTSGAVPLHAARDREARSDQDALGLGPDEKGVVGVRYPDGEAGDFPGTTTREGYTGGPASAQAGEGYNTGLAAGASDFGASSMGSSEMGGTSATGGLPSTGSGGNVPSGGSGPAAGAGVRPYVPEGPTYSGVVAGTVHQQGEFQPKGKNLIEGDVPETKTFLGDVGGPHDPGRVAEQGFAKINADAGGDGVARDGSEGKEQGNPYDVLRTRP